MSGKRHFEILKSLVESTWRELDKINNITSIRDIGKEINSKVVKSANVA